MMNSNLLKRIFKTTHIISKINLITIENKTNPLMDSGTMPISTNIQIMWQITSILLLIPVRKVNLGKIVTLLIADN
jgi:hypothetical protein